MVIECVHCHAKYQYDENRFERKPSKKIRCAKCHDVFEITNPAWAENATPAADPMDSTVTKSRARTTDEYAEAEAAAELEKKAQERAANADPADRPKLPQGQRLSLAIIDGPDAGSVFRVEKPRVTIGRSSADLVLNDSESSRNHAAIEVRDTVVMLEDLGSTNGTLIDGEKISGMVEIQNQTEFHLGSTTLMLIVTDSD